MQILDICKENEMDASDILSLLTLMLGKSIRVASFGNAQAQAGLTSCAIESLLNLVTEE